MKFGKLITLSTMAVMTTSMITFPSFNAAAKAVDATTLTNKTDDQKIKILTQRLHRINTQIKHVKNKRKQQIYNHNLKQVKKQIQKLKTKKQTKATSNNASSQSATQSNQSIQPTQDSNVTQAIQTGLNQINQERKQRGIAPFTINSTLSKIANERAQQIATNFSHYDGNGKTIAFQMADQQGYKYTTMAENIGQDLPNIPLSQSILDDIHDMMYDDADSNWGHRDNFLDSSMNQIGIGIYVNNQGVPYIAYDMGRTN